MSTTKVFLVGMPGSGKSSIGRLIAQALDMLFIDLDEIIEELTGMPIYELFEKQGEDYFRLMESKQLREIAMQQDGFVLATGGGTPCFHDNMGFMKKQGITVYIDSSFNSLLNRVKRKSHRPLLKGNTESALRTLLNNREQIYLTSQIHMNRDNQEKSLFALVVANKIKEIL